MKGLDVRREKTKLAERPAALSGAASAPRASLPAGNAVQFSLAGIPVHRPAPPSRERQGVLQRVLTASGPDGALDHGKKLISEAYKVDLPARAGNADVAFHDHGRDAWGQKQINVSENPRLGPENDGLGSHLIGKIIDDGEVHVFFGEDTNTANPTHADKSDRGEASGGRVRLTEGASAIELIHELIHTYHFNFDPWTDAQKNAKVKVGGEDVIAEEASTVGLDQWDHRGLTENTFRHHMGLPKRTTY